VTDVEFAPMWDLQRISALYMESSDVIIRTFQLTPDKQSEIVFIFCNGMTDGAQLGDFIMPELGKVYDEKQGYDKLKETSWFGPLPIMAISPAASQMELSEWLFEGQLLLLVLSSGALYRIGIPKMPERSPSESATEISIKGPKDGFVESAITNIALIRKRVRSDALCCETTLIGRRTRTKVSILYFKDILNPNLLIELRKRLNKIDIDGLYSIHQLESFLADQKYSIFPLLDYTGRPDKAVSSLLSGRFIIIVDGIPLILVGPANLSLLVDSPEDLHFNFQYVTFARMIRFISFLVSILLPGVFVALTAFHPDQIPFRLMATIATARMGLPFSSQVELGLLILMLEMFREAGVRLPSTIGQTLTVVGGLIIGDAAIRAGLASPSVVVVGSITAVTGVTLVNQSLSGAVSVLRIGIYLSACFFGMYGVVLSFILLIGYMSRLTSFGLPFLAPISPPVFRDLIFVIFRLPVNLMKKRQQMLHTIDKDNQGDESNENKK